MTIEAEDARIYHVCEKARELLYGRKNECEKYECVSM